MSASQDYDVTKIKVISGIDHIRLRPAMYIGGLDDYGLHRLLSGTLDNSLGRAARGLPSQVRISLEEDGSIAIEDDADGFLARADGERLSPLEVVITKLPAPGLQRSLFQRDQFVPDYVILSALSAELIVDNRHEGEAHRMVIERGRRIGAIEYRGPCDDEGLSLRFRLDPRIFKNDVRLVRRRLLAELQDLAALLPALTIELCDRRFGRQRIDRFHSPGGLSDLLSSVAETPLLRAPLRRQASEPAAGEGRIELDLALQLQEAPDRVIIGFVNGQRIETGSHEEAASLGLQVGLEELAERFGLAAPEGLGALLALSITHPGPSYNAARSMLLSADVHGPVANLVAAALKDWGERDRGEALGLLSKR